MPDVLEARTAVGTPASNALRTYGSASAVRVAEQPLAEAFTVRFDQADDETVGEIAALTGLRLEATARAVRAGGHTALWLGPGDWLVRFASDASVPTQWRRSPSARCVAIDTSDLWSVVRVQGACSRHVLAMGSTLDLDAARFPVGAAAVTQLARIRALLHHVEADAYDVYVERSYAAYVWAWLGDAVHEFLSVKERA
jgi:sarcosine oxidase subunit gamma